MTVFSLVQLAGETVSKKQGLAKKICCSRKLAGSGGFRICFLASFLKVKFLQYCSLFLRNRYCYIGSGTQRPNRKSLRGDKVDSGIGFNFDSGKGVAHGKCARVDIRQCFFNSGIGSCTPCFSLNLASGSDKSIFEILQL
jgi:hypothetical protein